MNRKNLSASLLAALFLATPAFAEEATIGRPIEGGSLHEGHLDMVVYYVPVDGDLLEVTATFAPKSGGDPLRVVMGLAGRRLRGLFHAGSPGLALRVLKVRRAGDGLDRDEQASASRRDNALSRRVAATCVLLAVGSRVRAARNTVPRSRHRISLGCKRFACTARANSRDLQCSVPRADRACRTGAGTSRPCASENRGRSPSPARSRDRCASPKTIAGGSACRQRRG